MKIKPLKQKIVYQLPVELSYHLIKKHGAGAMYHFYFIGGLIGLCKMTKIRKARGTFF